jgi:hypothetical protein
MSQPPLPNGLQPSDFYSPGSYTPFESVGFLMRKVLSSILQQADAQLAEHELTYVQWLPLYKLLLCSDATNAGMARDLGLDHEGRAMAAKVPQVLSSVMNAHMAGFSHDESRKLLDMLRRLLANGDAMRAPEGPAPTAGETRPAA